MPSKEEEAKRILLGGAGAVMDTALGPWSGRNSKMEADEIKQKLGVKGNTNAPRSTAWAHDTHRDSALTRQFSRGFIATSDEYEGDKWKLRCQFNPPEVSYSYRVGAERVASDRTGSDGMFFVEGASVNFELFLDRSFELAQRRNTSGQMLSPGDPLTTNGFSRWSPQNIGVLHDILVFNLVVLGTGEGLNTPGMIPEAKKVKLDLSPATLTGDQRLAFEGYITSTSVSFTRFTQDMVPMTAALNVGLQRVYDGGGGASSSDSGGGSSSSSFSFTEFVSSLIDPAIEAGKEVVKGHTSPVGPTAPAPEHDMPVDYFERKWG